MNRGDQLIKKFKIKDASGNYITPDNCYDMCIQIGSTEKTYKKSELTYDSTNNCWLFPLTQEMSLNMSQIVPHQERVVYKTDGVYTILSTEIQNLSIGDSVFTAYEE